MLFVVEIVLLQRFVQHPRQSVPTFVGGRPAGRPTGSASNNSTLWGRQMVTVDSTGSTARRLKNAIPGELDLLDIGSMLLFVCWFEGRIQLLSEKLPDSRRSCQILFPNPSWLTFGHQNLVSIFPRIDNCLMVTKRLRLVVYLMLLGSSRPCPWLILEEHGRSFLALTETWIKTDDPPVIKNDPAPPGYRITHEHRENPDQTRGGGLAVIHQDSINVSPRNHNITNSSFKFQLVNIGLKSRDIVQANIYHPSSSSKSIFLEEFSSLLATLGTDGANRLMICGDFNLPGSSPNKIDDDLVDLLNSTVSHNILLCFIRTTQNPPCSISLSLHPPQNLFLQSLLSVPTKFLSMI